MKNTTENGRSSRPTVSEDEIARRAYDIWIAQGRPEGAALEHWLMAETLLIAERHRDAALTARSAAATSAPDSPPRSVAARDRTERPALIVR